VVEGFDAHLTHERQSRAASVECPQLSAYTHARPLAMRP
jgi:hypothetical protein